MESGKTAKAEGEDKGEGGEGKSGPGPHPEGGRDLQGGGGFCKYPQQGGGAPP